MVRKTISRLVHGLYDALSRFPVALSYVFAFALVLIYDNHATQAWKLDTLTGGITCILMPLILGFFLSLALHLLFEFKLPQNKLLRILPFAGIALLLALYGWYLNQHAPIGVVEGIRFVAFLLASMILPIIISFLGRRKGIENALLQLLQRYLVSMLFTVVIGLGLTAILAALILLFKLKLENYYLDIWALASGLFAPTFFLSGWAKREDDLEDWTCWKFLRVLLLSVILPLMSAYGVILYAYFLKVLFTWTLPEGSIVHLTLWFLLLGAVILTVITHFTPVNRWSRLFRVWFARLALPLLVLMFYALWLRLTEYGFTENRYFVLIAGLWLLGTMIYFGFTAAQRNRGLLLSLALVTVLSVFGPWSAFSVSHLSQNGRLQTLLVENNILQNGSLVAAVSTVPDDDRRQIYSILRYYDSRQRLTSVSALPQNFTMDQAPTLLGFDDAPFSPYPPNPSQYIVVSMEKMPLIHVDKDAYVATFGKGMDQYTGDAGLTAVWTQDNAAMTLTIRQNDVILYEGGPVSACKQLASSLPTENVENRKLPQEALTFTDSNDKVEITYLVNSFNGSRNDSNGELSIDYIDFTMILRIK